MTKRMALAAALVIATATSASAQNTKPATRPADPPTETRTKSDAQPTREDQTKKDALRSHPGGLVEAKWLSGADIRDRDGHDLGRIKEIWLDPKTGSVKDVVVSAGGRFGSVDRVIAWKDLTLAWKDQKPYVIVDRQLLLKATEADGDVVNRSPSASPRGSR